MGRGPGSGASLAFFTASWSLRSSTWPLFCSDLRLSLKASSRLADAPWRALNAAPRSSVVRLTGGGSWAITASSAGSTVSLAWQCGQVTLTASFFLAMTPSRYHGVMLGAMADLVNEFSWSRSRDNLFQDCRRKYFYHYYGAGGGWEADAPEETRALYVLKQLSSRQQWAGKVVHEGVEWGLRALFEGRDLPEAWLVDETVRRMGREWKGANERQLRTSPKRRGVFSRGAQ